MQSLSKRTFGISKLQVEQKGAKKKWPQNINKRKKEECKYKTESARTAKKEIEFEIKW